MLHFYLSGDVKIKDVPSDANWETPKRWEWKIKGLWRTPEGVALEEQGLLIPQRTWQ